MIYYPEGPIEPGMLFVWEPAAPHAMVLVEVVECAFNGEETMVCSRAIMRHPGHMGGHQRDLVWNDESRFREAAAAVQIPAVTEVTATISGDGSL